MYKVEDSWGKDENNQTLKQMINTPYELSKIQPIATQVWNLYEIGFDTNGNCHKIICTYKFILGECIWNTQTGE